VTTLRAGQPMLQRAWNVSFLYRVWTGSGTDTVSCSVGAGRSLFLG